MDWWKSMFLFSVSSVYARLLEEGKSIYVQLLTELALNVTTDTALSTSRLCSNSSDTSAP